MSNFLNKAYRAFFVFVATAAYLLVASLGSVKATEIAWHYYDMHGQMMGAPKLTDPLTIIVTFLIIFSIGLTIWVASRNADEKEKEVDEGVSRSLEVPN
ncbi:hypothetical protein [Desulfonatronovibrio magnus]|uniref:hypothetical protein n=1 Tax=Desulfonatronovibrio magnus TaxID=698827 RepID=UPI0005EB1FA9|nr:hypothetical protein [Desulfonatronovibrio magnus]